MLGSTAVEACLRGIVEKRLSLVREQMDSDYSPSKTVQKIDRVQEGGSPSGAGM